MSANVIPFPFSHRGHALHRAADIIEEVGAQFEAAYRRRVLDHLERDMTAAGVSQTRISRELEAFDRAANAEFLRRKSSGYAASNPQGYPDGGDAA